MTDQTKQIALGLTRLSAFGRAAMWQAAAGLGLTPTQIEILQRAARRPERAGELAAHLGVSPATVSDSVAALCSKGLMVRRPDPADRRAHRLTLTEAGHKALAQIPPVPAPLHDAISGLPEADRQSLMDSLIGMIRSLQDARAIPVQRMCMTCVHFRPCAHSNAAAPHHCDFVNAAFADAALRLECGEHEMARDDQTLANWQRLAAR